MAKILLDPSKMTEITGFGGNIDKDALNPAINIAQNTHLKRILGVDLYDKMLEGNPTGVYLTIRNDYVNYILSFYSASIYLSLFSIKTTNNGSYKLSGGDGDAQVTHADLNLLSKNYEQVALSYEKNFIEFMNTQDVTEYPKNTKTVSRLINLY
jgi:hypothetical protein